MGTLRQRATDAVTVAAFKAAWKGIQHLPGPMAYRLFDVLADITAARRGPSVQRMRANYARLRPELSADDLDALVRAGVRSYLRYWCDAFRLPGMTHEDITSRVRTSGRIDLVRSDLDAGRSIVLFLGHMGNWDLAGAWSATELAHVTTVAEKLQPQQLFEEFLEFRERLGMTIIPLVKGSNVLGQVEDALRTPAAFAPLLADRDLTRQGVTVDLAGHPARVAAGPAVLAARTGARLVPVSITYDTPSARGRAPGITIHFHDPVAVPDASRHSVHHATQQCVDALAQTLTERTEEWHMMQRVFVDDLDARRLHTPHQTAPQEG